MAYPGLWAVGGVSVALVVAGIWLNRTGHPPEPATPLPVPLTEGTAEPAQVPLPSKAPEPDPLLVPPPPRDASDPRSAATADPGRPGTAAERPPPAGMISRVDGNDGVLWTPDGVRTIPTEAESFAAASGDDASVALQASSPAQPGHAAGTDGPDLPRADLVAYAGPLKWSVLPDADLSPAGKLTLRDALRSAGASPYFAAIVMDARNTRTFSAQGYATIAAAGYAAMELCALDRRRGCRLVAQLAPFDFDGRKGDTLTRAQGIRWDAFHDDPLPRTPKGAGFRAIALSEDGGVGMSDLSSAQEARQEALSECQSNRRKIRAEPIGPFECRIVAERGTPGHAAEPRTTPIDRSPADGRQQPRSSPAP